LHGFLFLLLFLKEVKTTDPYIFPIQILKIKQLLHNIRPDSPPASNMFKGSPTNNQEGSTEEVGLAPKVDFCVKKVYHVSGQITCPSFP
jgi:hypothetical protein